MGITGLLPFLDKSSKKTNISEFSGGTVAIDTYCWLHKGAFSCADKIIMGQQTDAYVKYCMKFVNMLLGHNIKPILVFDGRHLPAKAETEIKRRETRNSNRKRAAELIKMGNVYEGKNLLRRSLDVSHTMALEVIKACQACNVDCIVAPYEADSQLAYLSITGIADVVITEDSDLTLFGCKKIFFKMDLYGHGVLVEQDQLHIAMGLSISNFHIDKFRHMCILSGCDYLASLPGIGLGKACKFIVKNTDNDIYNALQRLASSLNMKSLTVTKEYRDSFMRALETFKYQLVYCPLQRKQVRLNPLPPDVTEDQLLHAGTEVDPELAYQLALGNCDPFTKKKLHDFDPDKVRPQRTNAWSDCKVAKHTSIWSKNFNLKKIEDKKLTVTPKKENKLPVKLTSTRGQTATMKTASLKEKITPKKRTYEEAGMSIDEILNIYKRPGTETKASKEPVKPVKEKVEKENCSSDEAAKSPVFARRPNPFKKPSDELSPSLLTRARRRLPVRSRLRATVIDDTAIPHSSFFAPKPKDSEEKKEKENEAPMDVAESMDVNVDEEDCKENMNFSPRRVIIPETEDFLDEKDCKENMDVSSRSIIIPDTQDFLDESGCKENINVSSRSIMTIPETEDFLDEKDCQKSMNVSSKSIIIPDTQDFLDESNCQKSIVIIPETEDFLDDTLPRSDSGYRGSIDERDMNISAMSCDESMSEKKPLHDTMNQKFSESKKEKITKTANCDEDMEFSITRQIFSEHKSSMFTYESPSQEKRLKRETSSSSSSQRLSQSSQSSSARRSVKSSSKKHTKIQGQQSLLNMFGFQKKNSLKH